MCLTCSESYRHFLHALPPPPRVALFACPMAVILVYVCLKGLLYPYCQHAGYVYMKKL